MSEKGTAGPAPGPAATPAPAAAEPRAAAPGEDLVAAGEAGGFLAVAPWRDADVGRLRPAAMLALQRTAGNRSVAMLLGRSGTRTPPASRPARPPLGTLAALQRQQAAPAMPGTRIEAPTMTPAQAELLQLEDDAYQVLVRVRGSGTVWLVDPRQVQVGLKEKQVAELTVTEVVPRSTAQDERKGFDSEGAATAYVVGAVGAGAVLRSGRFFFAARLGAAPALDRTKARRVDVQGPVVKVIGADGFVYVPGTIYQTDAAKAAATIEPAKEMAETASAADLARLAGIPRPEDKVAGGPPGAGQTPGAGGEGKVVEIPDSQVRAFLRQYMVARANEILDRNRDHARAEQATFKATDPGSESRAPSGLTPEAKRQVDAAREVGASFRKLIDHELYLEDLIARIDRRRSFGSGQSTQLVELEGKRLKVSTWYKRVETSRRVVAEGKARAMAENPLLAQMVDAKIPQEEWAKQAKDAVSLFGGAGGALGVRFWDRLTNQDNPYSRSELANPASAESDERVRAGYVEKLDAVLDAIEEVRAKVLTGDERTLWSMPGLRQRVQADLRSIAGPNAKLGPQLDKIMADLGASPGDIAATVITVAGVVLQLAGFFFPPAAFVGAVMTYGATAYTMDKALEQLKASQTGVTPAEALVDPVQAQKAAIDATIEVALEALNVGMEINVALDALEAGRVKDLEKLAEKGRKPGVPEETPGVKPDPDVPRTPSGTPGAGDARAADPLSAGAGPSGPGAIDEAITTRTGLASAEEIRKYGEKMAELQKQWVTKSPVERAFEIQARINDSLQKAGIPKNVGVAPSSKVKGYNATFNFDSWTVSISHDVLNNPAISPADIAKLADSAYHEARHAEQWWLMARLLGTGEKDAAVLARKLGIPQDVAEAAIRTPLAPGTEEYRAASRWYQSVYGSGKARRDELLREGGLLDQARAARDAKQKAYEDLVSDGAPRAMRDQALREWNDAYRAWSDRYQEYRNLPEEQDAWLIGSRAGESVPGPPPPPPGEAPLSSPAPVSGVPDTVPSGPPSGAGG